MALLPFLGGNKVWQTGGFHRPWDASGPSIWDHLDQCRKAGRDPNETDLPDEFRINDGHELRFVSGALDNLVAGDRDAGEVVRAVRAVMKRPGERQIGHLYRLLLDEGTIGIVDGAIERIVADPPDAGRFGMFFDWLARSSPDREPAKFAIAMLGVMSGTGWRELFLTFGAHEEFTKYAAVALSNAGNDEDAREAQIELARSVHGWGRIDLVDRLAPDGDAEFRHWLVREGFRNAIMDEYLAWTAATHGMLLEQLENGEPDDDALLDGAADIFTALVAGGPAEDMGDYPEGATAAFRWFGLVEQRPGTLARARAARALRDFATREDDPRAWGAEAAGRIGDLASAYLGRSELAGAARRSLEAGCGEDYWIAKQLAPDLGIDPWPFILELQLREPDGDRWYDLMRTDDGARIDQVIALAEERLPLERIAAGPGDEMGLGPEWRHHRALDFIVQDLRRFPGKGWPLIAAALRSPVIRNRNMAVRALAEWPKEAWPGDALALVRTAVREEPKDTVKDGLEALLKPESRD